MKFTNLYVILNAEIKTLQYHLVIFNFSILFAPFLLLTTLTNNYISTMLYNKMDTLSEHKNCMKNSTHPYNEVADPGLFRGVNR